MNLRNSIKNFIYYFDSRRKFLRSLRKCKSFLELGCGSGFNCKFMKRTNPKTKIYALDLYDKVSFSNIVNYKKVDLNKNKLPYPDSYFDAIFFSHVIEHLKEPWCLGPEINRVLRKNGRIYIEAPNWVSMILPSFGFKREQGDIINFFDELTHLRPCTKQGLYHFLRNNCRLNVVKTSARRNLVRVIFDPLIIIWGFLVGNRFYIMSSLRNLTGWSIYAIGMK